MKTICCFGHREMFRDITSADDITNLKENLCIFIERMIKLYDVETFLTGRRGEFDNLFSCVIRKLKEKYPKIKLVLVEPYFSNSLNTHKEYYESMYDSIIIPDELAGVHPKQAIKLRNKWMVENSFMVISYVNRTSGGAYEAIKYAEKIGVFVYNIGKIHLEI